MFLVNNGSLSHLRQRRWDFLFTFEEKLHMATFYIPLLKDSLPILEECYGFDICEVSDELSQIASIHHINK